MSSERVAPRPHTSVYGLVLALASLAPGLLATETGDPGKADASHAAKVLGPSSCSECHTEEFEVWRASAHEADSRALTRDPKAREIAKALGVRRMMSDERCAKCHFTLQQVDQRSKSVAGVSCESCHGGARDWVELHDDFGPSGVSASDESEAHRLERILKCDEMGMVRPSETHLVAKACFTCHVVDDAELIAAGHPTGAGFELLSWSQGEVRHNFIRNGKGHNAVADPAQRRMLYVIGQMLELRHAAEALGKATAPGPFAEDLTERIRVAVERLEAVSAAVEVGEVREAIEAARTLELQAGTDTAAFVASVEAGAARLCQRKANVDLQNIDPLLPAEDAFVGSPVR